MVTEVLTKGTEHLGLDHNSIQASIPFLVLKQCSLLMLSYALKGLALNVHFLNVVLNTA